MVTPPPRVCCSYPPVRSGGTGSGLLKPSRPTSQYVSTAPFTCSNSVCQVAPFRPGVLCSYLCLPGFHVVAQFEAGQDLHGAQADVDPVGCMRPKARLLLGCGNGAAADLRRRPVRTHAVRLLPCARPWSRCLRTGSTWAW